MNEKIKVLIADDHIMVAQGLKRLLELQNLYVFDEIAHNGKEAIQLTEKLRPDVLLLDVNMPEMNGLEALKYIKTNCPEQKVIMLSIHNSKDYINYTLNADGDGYVSKDADVELLKKAIETVHGGKKYIQPEVYRNTFKPEIETSNNEIYSENTPVLKLDDDDILSVDLKYVKSVLSPKELTVLYYMSRSMDNKDIAKLMGIVTKTVRNHQYNLSKVLGFNNRTEASLFAVNIGIDKLFYPNGQLKENIN